MNASHHYRLLEFAGACQNLFSEWPTKLSSCSKENPAHPSLHFKKIGNLWSARVGINYRAVAVEDGEDFIWVWVGPHDEYQRMIKQQG